MAGSPGGTASPERRLRRRAAGFMLGSACFFLGALPAYASWVGPVGANATFALGSVLFLVSGAVQLGSLGWRPPDHDAPSSARIGWWSVAVRLGGTLLFGVSTLRALGAALASTDTDEAGWVPDVWGSAAFLVSGVLAVVAAASVERGARSTARWTAWLAVLGSAAFVVSAAGAYVPAYDDDPVSPLARNLGTMVGALCFFAASALDWRGSNHR
ncbi:hypothetical protein [Agromyces indicus]|uniref:YrhK domain-containing protein n=1 Tax=Agromyces indicus TaxID=758919 RepID=A0ABU1FH48_9MICO|nr:hypothetical protein [Agromyces indicus]MDR5690697.1 hypothetical protein [Agromyces indicus]